MSRISQEAVDRAAEITSRNGGNSEAEHRAFAEHARKIDRIADVDGEKPKTADGAWREQKHTTIVETTIKHDR